MKLVKGKVYTTEKSDLTFTVLQIYKQTNEYVTAKIALKYKYGAYKGYIVETKRYNIDKSRILHWREHV